MKEQLEEYIASFNEIFSEFIASEYKIPENLSPAIDWYNSNIMLISMNNLCPIRKIEEVNVNTYMWAYSTGITTYANIKHKTGMIQGFH